MPLHLACSSNQPSPANMPSRCSGVHRVGAVPLVLLEDKTKAAVRDAMVHAGLITSCGLRSARDGSGPFAGSIASAIICRIRETDLLAAKTDRKLRSSPTTARRASTRDRRGVSRAGVALTGSESSRCVRAGDLSRILRDTRGAEIWLVNPNSRISTGGRFNHLPKAPAPAAVHRTRSKADGRGRARGMTLVPLKLYFNEKARQDRDCARPRQEALRQRQTEKKRSWSASRRLCAPRVSDLNEVPSAGC